MGIFKRLATLLKSNINDLISRAEDPAKILNQLIADMKDSLNDARKSVQVAMADEKILRKRLDKERTESKAWEKKAMMAIRAGRDDLAREALARKTDHQNLADQYQKQWEMQRSVAEKLRQQLGLLERKIGEAKRKKDLLIATQARIRAQEEIAKTMEQLSDNDALSQFAAMEERILKEEAEAEAAAELAGVGMSDSLEHKFSELEMGAGVDDDLMALKAKMGLVEKAPEVTAAEPELDEMDFDALEAALAEAEARASEEA